MSFSSNQPLQSNQLPISLDVPKEPDLLHTFLTNFIRNISNIVNTKEGALYSRQELANFQQWFSSTPFTFNNGYRTCFEVNPAALTFNHGISGITQVTNYWAIVNTASGFRKVPYASATLVTDQTQMDVTTTQVIITNGATAPAITGGIIVLEYIKT